MTFPPAGRCEVLRHCHLTGEMSPTVLTQDMWKSTGTEAGKAEKRTKSFLLFKTKPWTSGYSSGRRFRLREKKKKGIAICWWIPGGIHPWPWLLSSLFSYKSLFKRRRLWEVFQYEINWTGPNERFLLQVSYSEVSGIKSILKCILLHQ